MPAATSWRGSSTWHSAIDAGAWEDGWVRKTARLSAAALVTLLVVTGSCTGERTREAGMAKRRVPARRAARPRPERPRKLPKITNSAFGQSRWRVARATRDLRRIGLWDDLTKGLYAIHFRSRLGRDDVPEDGHLADALSTAVIDEDGQGGLCDIWFYPTAIADDLRRWRQYHADGRLDEPPPSPGQFWAAITAHELAHCLGFGRGEKAAERWEAKALARMART